MMQLVSRKGRGLARMFLTYLRRPACRRAILREVSLLPIKASGVEHGTPYVQLSDGPRFYGHLPEDEELELYRYLSEPVRRRLGEACIRVAVDIVCRYVYPHADVNATPPYPRKHRGAFHPQHKDTIADLTSCSEDERQTLRDRFSIRAGDTILDVGAYVGHGAMRLSEMVGPSGLVICMEADPTNAALLLKNLEANLIRNVRLVPAACWKEPGEMQLFGEGWQQRRSVIRGFFANPHTVTVAAETLDRVVQQQALSRLDLISLTINGAEIEALEGGSQTLSRFSPKLTVAGWFKRDAVVIHQLAVGLLRNSGYRTLVGPGGRVYAWKETKS